MFPAAVTVSVRAIRPLLDYVRSLGEDPQTLLSASEVDAATLHEPEARVPHTAAIRIWNEARTITGDPDLGLNVAASLRHGAFGAVEYVARTSPTLGAAFERVFRYHRAMHDVAETRFEVNGDRAVLSHQLPTGSAPRLVSDFVVAGWVTIGRQVTGAHWSPIEVRFPHAAPGDLAAYQRVFSAPVVFDHPRAELIVTASTLDLPVLTADPALHLVVSERAASLVNGAAPVEGIVDAVRRIVATELCDGEPTLAKIATRLHMSSRTLHRRLTAERTSFRTVVADVRRELAIRLLRDDRLAIGEVSFLLGFSEPSAFHRAFRRWMGHPPAVFRAEHV